MICNKMSFVINETVLDESNHDLDGSRNKTEIIIEDDDISSIEKELNVLQRNNCNNEMDFTMNKMNIFKNLITTLQEQVNTLTEEVKFLREDTLIKSRTISTLTNMMTINNVNNEISHDDVTMYNENISRYNKVISVKNVSDINKEININSTEILRELNSTPIASLAKNEKSYTTPPMDPNTCTNEINDSTNSNIDPLFQRGINQQKWIDEQLAIIREVKHIDFFNKGETNKSINKSINNKKPMDDAVNENLYRNKIEGNNSKFSKSENNNLWPENTVLITGDSMSFGLDEKRLSRRYNVKVRCHPGACLKDMYDHLNPYLRKQPKFIILHIATNDASIKEKTSDIIVEEILELKRHIEEILPTAVVFISCPIIRLDNGLANLKLIHVKKKLKNINVQTVDHENITQECLGRKGLHLNERGTKRYAMNFLLFLKHL